MNYREFICAMKEEVRSKAKGALNVCTHESVKNNGEEKQGITLVEEGGGIAPTIYLDGFYAKYKKGVSIEEMAEDILALYQETKRQKMWKCECLASYEAVKAKITYRVINEKYNEAALKKVPHRLFLDLAVVYYVMLEINEAGTAAMQVNNEYIEKWGVNEEELYRTAQKNTRVLLKPEFQSMREVIGSMTGAKENDNNNYEKDDMYILSNEMKNYGAASILNESMLEYIRRRIGENYYVIPSSIHEMIIVGESRSPGKRELERMICEMNTSQVANDEVLSNRAYYYDGRKRALCI